MILKKACEIGYDCGLVLVRDAILNIEFHCISIFSYDEINKELIELHSEFANVDNDATILELFPDLEEKEEEKS